MPTIALCGICMRPIRGPVARAHEDTSAAPTFEIRLMHGGSMGEKPLLEQRRDFVCNECSDWYVEQASAFAAAIAARRAKFEEITREITAQSFVDANNYVALLGAVTPEEEDLVRRIAARQEAIAKAHLLSSDAYAVAVKKLAAGGGDASGGVTVIALPKPEPESV